MKEKFNFIVQFSNADDKPTICGDSFMSLDSVTVNGIFKSTRMKRAFKIIEDMYPEYKGFIGIF